MCQCSSSILSLLLQFSTTIFLPETDFVLFLALLENSVLPNGLRQLTRDVKSDVRIISFISNVIFVPPLKTPNDVRKMSLCDVVVVVSLLFYVHGKHLRSCRDGQLT